jgi:tetratricopeptide (TPR) repeat protein
MNFKTFHYSIANGALCWVCAFAWSVTTGAAPTTNYQGAEAVLRQAAESGNKTKSKDDKLSPNTQLRADLKAFGQQSAPLTPGDAAAQWLALADRLVQMEETHANYGQRGESNPVREEELMEALPPPASWAELEKAIEARPPGEGSQALHELGLRLLAHTLVGDAAKRSDDIASLQGLAAKAKSSQTYFYSSLFEGLSRSMIAAMDNPDAVLQALNQKLAAQQSQEGFQSTLEIPDLVTLVGPEKAETFLRRALVKSKSQLEIEGGTATGKLAQKLALELIGDLKAPQWSLVNSLESVDLYEAMEKRFTKTETNEVPIAVPGMPSLPFPAGQPDDYQKQNARVYYLLGLIAQGRTTNAVTVAMQFEKDNNASFPDDAIRQMERAGFAGQLNSFFHELLQQNPDLPFWEEYVQLAARAGQTAEMVKMVRTTITKPDISKGQRLHLQQLLYQALLADDQVDAGVAGLRGLIQSNEPAIASQGYYWRENRGTMALKLAQIGHLLNRPEWQEEGIAIAKESLQKQDEPDYSSWGNSIALPLATFLEGIDRGTETEMILATALSKAVSNKANQRMSSYEGDSTAAAPILVALARLYHDAGRDADVLELFDNAPYWGVKDLADLNFSRVDDFAETISSEYTKHVTVPVGYYAASAMAKTGHPAEAHKLLDSLFIQSPGCDRLYELLLSLDDQGAPAELDTLFARDQFEERPLIWKAHWLRTHQQLEEAEKVARRAISIDPTDGEEGPGDRLRAYAELAEIRAARGDTNEAVSLRGAVQAVHQAEKADQIHAVGLLKQAVALYQDSLTRFADAYCIHARLAVQLSDLGLHDLAEEHYRRAYELMPDSFGRLESYCFGCERAFDGDRAQGIAEKVFTQLAQKTPNKPQVHYLLGYLRDEEGRYPEALNSYRAAVKLDPDYLNAWQKIECIGPHVFQPAADRDAVVFNLLRLDPLGKHTSPSFETVSDLAALWRNVAAAGEKRSAKPESLYPLPASKAEMEKQEAQASEQGEEYRRMTRSYSQGEDEIMTPGEAIAQNGFVRAAEELLGSQAMNGVDE